MKPHFLVPACLAATLFVLAGPAPADQESAQPAAIVPPAAGAKPDMSAADAEILKRYDKNGDGKLDATERAAMERVLRDRLEKNPRMLKRFDTDGDGKLSDAEWAAVREKLFARFEKDVAK